MLLSPQSHFLPFRPVGDNEHRGDGETAASPGQGVSEDLDSPPTMHKPAHQRRPKEQGPHATAQTPAQPPQPLSGAEAKGHKSSIQSGAFFAVNYGANLDLVFVIPCMLWCHFFSKPVCQSTHFSETRCDRAVKIKILCLASEFQTQPWLEYKWQVGAKLPATALPHLENSRQEEERGGW